MSRADELSRRLRSELEQSGTKARAVTDKAYLKSELAHFGVPMPIIRKQVVDALRELRDLTRDELVAAVAMLWAPGIHELRAAAIELLCKRGKLLESKDAPLVERLLRASQSWAYVDVLAVHVMGPLVVRDPKLARTLDRWAKDDNFWIRRSALLALLVPLRNGDGDFARFTRFADAMLDEEEFFIRKAIGWILRDIARKRPQIVFDWIAPRASRASGVTMREVVKYLSPSQREQLIGKPAR